MYKGRKNKWTAMVTEFTSETFVLCTLVPLFRALLLVGLVVEQLAQAFLAG
jgi:hypothetical protein